MHTQNEQVVDIPVKKVQITNNVSRPRTNTEVADLMVSIKHQGLINPITVAPLGNRFEVVAGHRRYAAFKKLGYKTIPAIIRDYSLKKDKYLANLGENVVRSAPTLQEEGHAYIQLRKLGLTEDEIAGRLGVTKQRVKNCMEIWKKMPKGVLAKVRTNDKGGRGERKGTMSFNAAFAIAQRRYPKAVVKELTDAALKGASTHQIKRMISDYEKGRPVRQSVKKLKTTRDVVLHFVLKKSAVEKLEKKHGLAVTTIFRRHLETKFKNLFA